MKIKHMLVSAALVGLAACGGGESQETADTGVDNMAMDNMAAADPMANTADMAAMPSTGQEYAAMAAASDLYEIESSRLAQEKGQNADVKALAQMLITDHEKSTADLRTAAQQAQPAITVEPQMNPEQQANMQALQAASGAEFDRLYLQQQVPVHEKALAMVQGYAQNGDVEALRQHAQTVAGPIQQHLERARQLQTQVGQ